jgi:hypothetical protein
MNRRQVLFLALGAALVLAAHATPAAAQPHGGERGDRGERGEGNGRGQPRNERVPDDRQRWYGVPLGNGPILTDQQRRALLRQQPPPRPRGPPRGRE